MAPHSSTLAWKIPWLGGAWWAAVHGVAKSQTRLSNFTFTFYFHALEKEMATHSSVLAWRIPGTGEPGGLTSMGSHKVGHDWSNLAAAAGILYIFWICDFYSYMYCIYLLPICDLTFQAPNWIYFWKEALNFNVVQIITLHLLCNSAFLCCFYFICFVLKILYQHHKDILTYYILKCYFPFHI